MKTIEYADWMKGAGKKADRARFILEHFDVPQLKRKKKAPGVARRRRGR